MEQISSNPENPVKTRLRYNMNPHAFYGTVAAFGAWEELNPPLSPEDTDVLEAVYTPGEFKIDRENLNNLFASFKQEQPLDPHQTTLALEACSPLLAASMAADSGLLRPQQGREQIEAELQGFEEDYLGFFASPEDETDPNIHQHNAELRQIIRAICGLRSILKPFVKELTGKNWRETIKPYLNQLSDQLAANLDPQVMSPQAQQTMRLFWKYDIGGKLLWEEGYSQQEHNQMKAECPTEFSEDLDDLILISYLCSGSAHTSYRQFTNRKVDKDHPDRKQPAVLDIDQLIQPETGDPGTLDRFFMRSTPTGPLKLEPASRRRARTYLNCSQRVEDLVQPYTRYAKVPGLWSATLDIQEPGLYVPAVQEVIDRQARISNLPLNTLLDINRETGEVKALSLVRDPSGSRGAPKPNQYEEVVRQLEQEQQWPRRSRPAITGEGDAYACIGIVPGYGPDQHPVQGVVDNAQVFLKRHKQIDWGQIETKLLYAVWANDGKLIRNKEKLLVVSGSLRGETPDILDLDVMYNLFRDVAASLRQHRFYGGVRTISAIGAEALTFAEGS